MSYNEIYEKLQSHIKEKTSLYSRRIVAQVMAGKDEDFMESEFTAVLNISLDELKTTIKILRTLNIEKVLLEDLVCIMLSMMMDCELWD